MARYYPPGVSPPLGEITPTNQSGLILVMTSMGLCFVLASLGVRLHMRLTTRFWKAEDSIVVVATFLSIIQATIVYYEVHLGLGRLNVLSNSISSTVNKWYSANNILYILTLALSKLSVGFLYLYLTGERTGRSKPRIRILSVIGACGAWAVLSILLLLINCVGQEKCHDPFARWLVIGVVDCITDAALVMESVYIVWKLHIPKTQKVEVVSMFGTRLLTVPLCALRLYYLHPSTLTTNRVLATSLVVVFTQAHIGYGMLAASLPCVRPFIMVYEKGSESKYGHLSNKRVSARSSALKINRSISIDVSSSSMPSSPTQPSSIYSQRNQNRNLGPREKDYALDEISVVSSNVSKQATPAVESFTFPLESHPFKQARHEGPSAT